MVDYWTRIVTRVSAAGPVRAQPFLRSNNEAIRPVFFGGCGPLAGDSPGRVGGEPLRSLGLTA